MDMLDYSREQHAAEKNDLTQVKAHLSKAIECLSQHFDTRSASWPYVITNQSTAAGRYSFSTNAMTTFALATSSGRCDAL